MTRLQYAWLALAGQISADDHSKLDAVFNKARWWQLTDIIIIVPTVKDITEWADHKLVCIVEFISLFESIITTIA